MMQENCKLKIKSSKHFRTDPLITCGFFFFLKGGGGSLLVLGFGHSKV